MDAIDKWLKSLRLHKYTHLFKTLTYDEMLNLEEKYLIDKEVTKGARNKMLISIKKLNLRQERLLNMIDDLDDDNISMKEALTVLKDILITPIPHPASAAQASNGFKQFIQFKQTNNCLKNNHHHHLTNNFRQQQQLFNANNLVVSQHLSQHQQLIGSNRYHQGSPASLLSLSITPSISSTLSSSSSAAASISPAPSDASSISNSSISLTISGPSSSSASSTTSSLDSAECLLKQAVNNSSQSDNYYINPYNLTYLFIETLEKVTQRLIESVFIEDNSCHGIMAAIVDECLKHNSFTKEQKAKVASFKQMAKTASSNITNNNLKHFHHLQQQQQQQQQQQYQTRSKQSYNHRNYNSNSHFANRSVYCPDYCNSQSDFREYSLLNPAITFELACLKKASKTTANSSAGFYNTTS